MYISIDTNDQILKYKLWHVKYTKTYIITLSIIWVYDIFLWMTLHNVTSSANPMVILQITWGHVTMRARHS
jgi:hypothetical protein